MTELSILIVIISFGTAALATIIVAIDIARSLRKIAFYQERMMHASMSSELHLAELTENYDTLMQYLNGIDFPRKIIPKAKERGEG